MCLHATRRLGRIDGVADVVLTKLPLVASHPLTVYVAEALRKCGGECITNIGQENKESDHEYQQNTDRRPSHFVKIPHL